MCEHSSYNLAGCGGWGGEVCVGSHSATFLEKEGVENWSERERGTKPSHTETETSNQESKLDRQTDSYQGFSRP